MTVFVGLALFASDRPVAGLVQESIQSMHLSRVMLYTQMLFQLLGGRRGRGAWRDCDIPGDRHLVTQQASCPVGRTQALPHARQVLQH